MKENQMHHLLESIRSTAQTSLYFVKNEYDRAAYSHILQQVGKIYGLLPYMEEDELPLLDKVGYITPKVGVNAIIFNEKGEVLLEKRKDDHCWGLIGGWCEPGHSPEGNILREIGEETGFDAEIIRMARIFTRKASERYLYSSYHIVYHCRITGGTLRISHESEAVDFRSVESVTDWHADHGEWVAEFLGFPQK